MSSTSASRSKKHATARPVSSLTVTCGRAWGSLVPATSASNFKWWLDLHPQSRVRTSAAAPLLTERFVATGVEVTPAPWFPLFSGDIAYGRLADALDNRVRTGMRGNLSSRLRPLARLELEPQPLGGLAEE